MKISETTKTFLKRLAERVIWTAVEVGAAAGLAHADLLPVEYVPVATVVLAALKGLAARHIGDKSSPAIGAK